MAAGKCEEKGCRATHKTDKWNNIKAHADGWYMQKDGKEWCPDHRPEWAPKTWRGWKQPPTVSEID